ncbi:MAG: SH3 domain-containing protein [Anaerolineae bacterium]|nr:SH3 domain-containing protein [Anaerolineae bacterium]
MSRLPFLFVILALLACTLSFDGGSGDTNGVPVSDAGGSSATIPTVRVVAPTNGQQVPINQRVDVTVETDSTATSFLLSVNGRSAGSKAMPPDQSGPTSAILTFTPDRAGPYTLDVRAYNGSRVSAPALITVEASASAVSGSNSGSSGSGAGCTARILVTKLNFRDAPNTDAIRLGQFEVGETVTVVGRNADTSWWQVRRATDDRLVWVINRSAWIQTEGDCSNVPVGQ